MVVKWLFFISYKFQLEKRIIILNDCNKSNLIIWGENAEFKREKKQFIAEEYNQWEDKQLSKD